MLRAREPTSPGGFRWLRIEPVGTVVSDVRDHVSIAHPSVYFFLSRFVFSRLGTGFVESGRVACRTEKTLEIEGSRVSEWNGLTIVSSLGDGSLLVVS